MTINRNALGLALAGFGGVSMFVGTMLAAQWGYAEVLFETWGSLYPGYSVTVGGSLIGLVYGLIDGYICGYVIAWLYNHFASQTK